jgi:secondary thiamine-phosphate synthase enzyme
MGIHTEHLTVETQGMGDTRDLTDEVRRIVDASGVAEGVITVFCPGSTGGVTTIEFEPGAVQDLRDCFERIASQALRYAHNERWGDGNGFSHVRAALLGPSLSVPLVHREMSLGTWQQIVFIDFDNRPRRRRLIVQVMGE